MVPFISVMAEPIKGALPLAIVFVRFSFIFILMFGVIFKWSGLGKYDPTPEVMWGIVEDRWEKYAFKNSMSAFTIFEGVKDLGPSIAIIFPIAVASFIETMENVELAAEKGDQY